MSENNDEKMMHECGRMPEVLASILDEGGKNMPELPEATRRQLYYTIGLVEGSNLLEGLTCIAKEDYPKVKERILADQQNGHFENDPDGSYQESLRLFLQSMNRHCDECTRQDCENRVRITREQLVRLRVPDSSRSAKVNSKYISSRPETEAAVGF